MFRTIVIILSLLIQYYCFRRITSRTMSTQRSGPTFTVVAGLFIVMNIPLLIFLFWVPRLIEVSKLATYSLIYPFYIWHFSFFLVGLVLLVVGIVKSPFLLALWVSRRVRARRRAVRKGSSGDVEVRPVERRTFLRQGVTILIGAAFTGSAYGAFKKDDYETTYITIPIKDLPGEFAGFSIGLVSDIHSSVFMTKEMMIGYADAVNSLSADLIAVTGDFVNSQVEEVYPFAEAFERLRARHGVFGVLGNHDYYSRNVEEVARRVEECGIRLLVDSHVRIEKDGKSIILLGSDDIGRITRAEESFDRATQGIDAAASKILMCHRPYYFETAVQRGIDLILSGHTHGGQIVFGKFSDDYIAPARVASKYVAGIYSIGPSHMYVSRGIGTVGVPVRINCPPEITKIILARG